MVDIRWEKSEANGLEASKVILSGSALKFLMVRLRGTIRRR